MDPLRYPFRSPRGALAIIVASQYWDRDSDRWVRETGHDMTTLREQLEHRGFTVVGELGTADSECPEPTAENIRTFIDELAAKDYSEHDALMVIIAAHGEEGRIKGWPNPGDTALSGPIHLREAIFSKFQPVGQSSTTTTTRASRTLAFKPKIFLVDACRVPPNAAAGSAFTAHVEDPLRPPVVPSSHITAAAFQQDEGGVFDGYVEGQWYKPPAVAASGRPTNRYADFAFGFATVPFNEAGALPTRSLFLDAFASALRDSPPTASFVDQMNVANGKMVSEHGKENRVKIGCFPQCSQILCTLTRMLYFDAPRIDSPTEVALMEVRDLCYAAKRKFEEDPDDENAQELERMRREIAHMHKMFKRRSEQHAAAMREAPATTTTRSAERGDDEQPCVPPYEPAKGDVAHLASLLERMATMLGARTAHDASSWSERAGNLAQNAERHTKELSPLLAPSMRQGWHDVCERLSLSPIQPRLKLLSPGEERQVVSRGVVTREFAAQSDDDDGDDYAGSSTASAAVGSSSSAATSRQRHWTSVPVGVKLQLELRCGSRAAPSHVYVFHMNEKDELCVVFPCKYEKGSDNRTMRSNLVTEAGAVLQIPNRFEPRRLPKPLGWMSFTGDHLQKETFFMIVTETPLESFPGVGTLPDDPGRIKMPLEQARAVLAAIQGATSIGARTREFCAEADDNDEADAQREGALAMGMTSLILISVGEDNAASSS